MTKIQKVIREKDQAYRPYGSSGYRRRKSNAFGKMNSSTWTQKEESLYVDFLKNNQNHFIDVQQRKKAKVFVAMSLYLKKRGPDQCRSHHQKMSIKYGSISTIIEKITQEKINKTNNKLQQQNFSKQQKEVEAEKDPELEISMEEEVKVEDKNEDIGLIDMDIDSSKQEIILWDYLNQDAWVNE